MRRFLFAAAVCFFVGEAYGSEFTDLVKSLESKNAKSVCLCNEGGPCLCGAACDCIGGWWESDPPHRIVPIRKQSGCQCTTHVQHVEPQSYAEAYHEAVKSKKSLVLWVGTKPVSTSAPKDAVSALVTHCDGQAEPGKILVAKYLPWEGIAQGPGFRHTTLRDDATEQEISVALAELSSQAAAIAVAQCGPGGCGTSGGGFSQMSFAPMGYGGFSSCGPQGCGGFGGFAPMNFGGCGGSGCCGSRCR